VPAREGGLRRDRKEEILSDHDTHAPDERALSGQADAARQVAVRMVGSLGLGYLGQVASSAELLTVVLGRWLRSGVDRFVLSPSHYVTAVYAVGSVLGLLEEDLDTYGREGSRLETIGTERTPLVDFTCGSLGQGLSVGIGYALADRLTDSDARTLVFCSDGEMEEGQTWEAALFAAHQRLTRLTVLLDCNDSQVDGPVSSVTTLEPLAAKWEAFGWEAREIDGHDPGAIWTALAAPFQDRPRVVVARTSPTKGLDALRGTQNAHFVTVSAELEQRLIDDLAKGAS
jgi:transketolase